MAEADSAAASAGRYPRPRIPLGELSATRAAGAFLKRRKRAAPSDRGLLGQTSRALHMLPSVTSSASHAANGVRPLPSLPWEASRSPLGRNTSTRSVHQWAHRDSNNRNSLAPQDLQFDTPNPIIPLYSTQRSFAW